MIFNNTRMVSVACLLGLIFSAMRLKETVDLTYRELCDIKDALKSPTDPEMSPDESEK